MVLIKIILTILLVGGFVITIMDCHKVLKYKDEEAILQLVCLNIAFVLFYIILIWVFIR